VGGQARKIGKTSVVCGLIQGLNTFAWTAVKISHHAGDDGSQDTASADDLPVHHDFLLSDETDPKGEGDTSLYLAAGARRSIWLRTRGAGLARAMPGLLDTLNDDAHVIMESNSVLGFLKPVVFLMLIGGSGREDKDSARQFLERADAFVTVGHDLEARFWPATSLQMPKDKPIFRVSPGEWSNPALCRFVGERLAPL
jgi:hypothetical protein